MIVLQAVWNLGHAHNGANKTLFGSCRITVDLGFGGIFGGYFRSLAFFNLPGGRHF